MKGFRQVELQTVAEIIQGGRHKLSGNHFITDGGFPAYGAGGLNGYLPTAEFDRNGVVLSSIGARCGKCFFVNGKWSSLANTQVILPDESQVDALFLWYQLNDEKRWPRAGVAQPFIKPSDVKRHLILLPPLEEQKRIAAILDQADELRRKRQRALDRLNQLGQAIFIEMFVEHEQREWPTLLVEELVDQSSGGIRTGPFGSQLLHSEFVDDGIAVLGIDNAVSNQFQWGQRRYISPEKYNALKRYRVYPGDVIITIMGTCGRCAIVPPEIPLAINTKHLCCISLQRDACAPEYLHSYFLTHPAALDYLRSKSKGAIMDGLNMGIIKAMPIRLPPLRMQQEFVEKLKVVEEQRSAASIAAAMANQLFTSLQQRAFSGELTTSSQKEAAA
jgi:type I restriction enzyme S subunit